MESDSMIHRANQIALFFASYPHDEAVAGVTDHLKKFWEPRMREQIIEYVAHGGRACTNSRSKPSSASTSPGSARAGTQGLNVAPRFFSAAFCRSLRCLCVPCVSAAGGV